jgi:uncharacterized protein YbdZ (MbtH family)
MFSPRSGFGSTAMAVTELFSDGGCGGGTGGGGIGDPSAGIQQMSICVNTPIPDGWIKVNTANDQASCGNPSSGTVQNIWVIEQYAGRPIGTRIWVRGDTPLFPLPADLPAGWVEKDRKNDLFGCGRPDTVILLNMIERVE